MDEEKERNPEGQRDKEKSKLEKFYRNGILEVRIIKEDT